MTIRVSNDSNFFSPYHQPSVDFFTAFSTLLTSILTLSNFLASFRAWGLFCLWPCYIRRDGMWSGKWGVNPGLTHIRSQIVRLSSSDQPPLPAASSRQMQLSVIAVYRLRTFLSFLNLYKQQTSVQKWEVIPSPSPYNVVLFRSSPRLSNHISSFTGTNWWWTLKGLAKPQHELYL